MSNLYFLERMAREKLREVERRADVHRRLSIHTLRDGPSPAPVRRLVGAWLIRVGRRLQRVERDPRRVAEPVPGRAAPGGSGHGSLTT